MATNYKIRDTQNLPPADHLVEGSAVKPLVLGVLQHSYHGRTLVAYDHNRKQFGSTPNITMGVRPRTVHKGILNAFNLADPPSPYWALVDAMSDHPEGFTRAEVIEQATRTVGEDKRQKVIFAWEVVINHHRHLRRREAALPFMVYRPTGKLKGKLFIRPRKLSETIAKAKAIPRYARNI